MPACWRPVYWSFCLTDGQLAGQISLLALLVGQLAGSLSSLGTMIHPSGILPSHGEFEAQVANSNYAK